MFRLRSAEVAPLQEWYSSANTQFCFVASRAGAFSANFTPDVLDSFRALCKQQSKSYTKVLERLAELYLETGGEVLNLSSVPSTPKQAKLSLDSAPAELLKQLQQRLEQLETGYRTADDHLEGLIESIEKRLQILEK